MLILGVGVKGAQGRLSGGPVLPYVVTVGLGALYFLVTSYMSRRRREREQADKSNKEAPTVIQPEGPVTKEAPTVIQSEGPVTKEAPTVIQPEGPVTKEAPTVTQPEGPVTKEAPTVTQPEGPMTPRC